MQPLLKWVLPCVLFFCAADTVFGASLYIEPNTTEIRPGDTLSFNIRLDTDEGECVNAVDAVLEYSPNIVPVDVSRGNSIFPIWVEEPVIDTENNRITFAGGLPNGYCGRIEGDPRLTNTLVELLFQAPGFQIGIGARDPNAFIRFTDETRAYLNDGLGTQAPLVSYGSNIYVHDKPGSTIVDEWISRVNLDEVPPEEFAIDLQTDPSIFSGKYFIVFNTTDKQSGMDHFEVIEEPIDNFTLFTWGGVDAPWVTARSPYVLTDQTLNSIIRVKALDKAGNEYIATYIPEESLRGLSLERMIMFGLMGAAGLLLLVVIGTILIHMRRRKKNDEDESIDEE